MVKELTPAFKDLRKKNLFARQNFWCCQSCGYAALARDQEVRLERGLRGKDGYVFFHHQDQESFNRYNEAYLAYGEFVDSPLTTEDIGKIIVEVLDDHGLYVEWDGQDSSRILVNLEMEKYGDGWLYRGFEIVVKDWGLAHLYYVVPDGEGGNLLQGHYPSIRDAMEEVDRRRSAFYAR